MFTMEALRTAVAALMEYDLWADEAYVDMEYSADDNHRTFTFARAGQDDEGRDRQPLLHVEVRNATVWKVVELQRLTRILDNPQQLLRHALLLKALSVILYTAERRQEKQIGVQKKGLMSVQIDRTNSHHIVTLTPHPLRLDGYLSFMFDFQGRFISEGYFLPVEITAKK